MARVKRDNWERFQKDFTINITNHLREVADTTATNVKLVIADELEKKYKENIIASYTPRTIRGAEIVEYNKNSGRGGHKKKLTYRHTGIFANSVYTVIDGNKVKAMIREEQYPDGASTIQVYKWLTEGTNGDMKSGKPYPYIKHSGNDKSDPNSYSTGWSRNYPTPRHEFEEYTMLHMLGFIQSLEGDIKNGKYSTFRYTGKKKPREYYKGQDVRKG